MRVLEYLLVSAIFAITGASQPAQASQPDTIIRELGMEPAERSGNLCLYLPHSPLRHTFSPLKDIPQQTKKKLLCYGLVTQFFI